MWFGRDKSYLKIIVKWLVPSSKCNQNTDDAKTLMHK